MISNQALYRDEFKQAWEGEFLTGSEILMADVGRKRYWGMVISTKLSNFSEACVRSKAWLATKKSSGLAGI